MMNISRVRGTPLVTFVSVASVVRSERLSFSSTKYGPTVSSGVRMHAVLPVPVVVLVVVVVVVVALVFVPPPQPSIAPAPATAKIPMARRRLISLPLFSGDNEFSCVVCRAARHAPFGVRHPPGTCLFGLLRTDEEFLRKITLS